MEKIKRGNMKFLAELFFIILISLTFVSANCKLDVSLLNQDPDPAIPNDYVDVVFQMTGVSDSECEGAFIELVPEYPFSLDNNDNFRTINGTYVLWNKEYWNIPYKIRVDKDALDGKNEITINYGPGSWKSDSYLMKKFNITIEDSRTDFDLAIQDYSYSTNTLTLTISNIGDSNANSVTVEVPPQANIEMKGSNKNIVGNIEASDYTSINFKAIPKDGEIIIDIFYTDDIGIRRQIEKSVLFSKDYYQEVCEENLNGTRPYVYILIGVTGIIIFFFLFRYFTKKRKKVSEISETKKK